jgi:hypothetical protein
MKKVRVYTKFIPGCHEKISPSRPSCKVPAHWCANIRPCRRDAVPSTGTFSAHPGAVRAARYGGEETWL